MIENYSLEGLELALREMNWMPHVSANPYMTLWLPTESSRLVMTVDEDEAAVFIPVNPQAPDFNRLIHRAIQQLASLSAEDIREELQMAELRVNKKLDKMQLRVEEESYPGILPWQRGVDSIDGIRKILIASAKTTQENKRHFANFGHTIASNYLESCYMGQTEIGSYIISAYIPTEKNIKVSENRNNKEHSVVTGRDITGTMTTALDASKEALSDYLETKDEEVFEWAVSQGVSADILGGIKRIIGNSETEIRIEYVSLTKEESGERSYVIDFTPDLKVAAEKGHEVLSKTSKSENIRIAGEVIGLKRKYELPNSARIKLRCIYKSKTRSFSIRLQEEDYHKAIEAHDKNVMLVVEGKAEKGVFTDIKSVLLTTTPVSSESTDGVSGGKQLDLMKDL